MKMPLLTLRGMLAEFIYPFIPLFCQHTVLSPCHTLGIWLVCWEDIKPPNRRQIFPLKSPESSGVTYVDKQSDALACNAGEYRER